MARPDKLKPIELFRDLIRDPERKSIFRMTVEILYLLIVFKKFPRHYFSRYLFKIWRTNINDFLPAKFLYNIKPFFNEKEVREVLENKLYFDLYYSQFGIKLPKILMYNYRKLFVIGKRCININDASEFRSLIGDLIRQNSLGSIFIKRTYWSYGGDKIFKIYPDQVDNEPETMEDLYNEVIKTGFLFQETVKQHSEMNKLNPSCINTIRVDTFIDKDGNIEIISGYLRMSVKNLPVDNTTSGGCYVGLDMETGRLKKFAFTNFISTGVTIFTEHPVTKITFENFKVPMLEEAKEMIIKAAGCMPGLRLVGWDIALGETGPVLIEGNSDYDISGNDNAYGGYGAHPVFKKILGELKTFKRG